ncbi:MAG: tetratricopeptide repeat protein [Acidobacteria bacterium]|nr:tetratricopeptide repeat protein [Acidobacteriota bacterium]
MLAKARPFDCDEPPHWTAAEALMPHTRVVRAEAGQRIAEIDSVGLLLNQASLYLRLRGLYQEAKEYCELALASALRQFGPDHPNVAISRSNLANILGDLGGTRGRARADPTGARIGPPAVRAGPSERRHAPVQPREHPGRPGGTRGRARADPTGARIGPPAVRAGPSERRHAPVQPREHPGRPGGTRGRAQADLTGARLGPRAVRAGPSSDRHHSR